MEAHTPAPYDKDILMAVRACIAGVATDGQQKMTMDWIITKAANLYDMSYRPRDTGATDFHEGRRFVGSQIVKMLRPETLQALDTAPRSKRKSRQEAKPND
jgi:hypothetical protein